MIFWLFSWKLQEKSAAQRGCHLNLSKILSAVHAASERRRLCAARFQKVNKQEYTIFTDNGFLKGSRVQLVIPLDSYVLDKVVPIAPSLLVND